MVLLLLRLIKQHPENINMSDATARDKTVAMQSVGGRGTTLTDNASEMTVSVCCMCWKYKMILNDNQNITNVKSQNQFRMIALTHKGTS